LIEVPRVGNVDRVGGFDPVSIPEIHAAAVVTAVVVIEQKLVQRPDFIRRDLARHTFPEKIGPRILQRGYSEQEKYCADSQEPHCCGKSEEFFQTILLVYRKRACLCKRAESATYSLSEILRIAITL